MNTQEIEKQLKRIDELIKTKKFAVSEKEAQKLKSSFGKNISDGYDYYIDSCIIYAESLIKNIKNLKAFEEIENDLQLFPFETKLLDKAYEIAIKLKRINKAETFLKRLVEINPNDFYSRLKLVRIYIENKDSKNALFELNTLLQFETYDFELFSMYLYLLTNEKLLYEKLNKIHILEELLPNEETLLAEEAVVQRDLGRGEKSFETIHNYCEYILENESFDVFFPEHLKNFKDIYLKTGNRDLLLKLLIRFTASEVFIKGKNNIQNTVENLFNALNAVLIGNFLLKNNLIFDYSKTDKDNLMENILLLTDNIKLTKIPREEIEKYLDKNKVYNLLPDINIPFIKSLVKIERT